MKRCTECQASTVPAGGLGGRGEVGVWHRRAGQLLGSGLASDLRAKTAGCLLLSERGLTAVWTHPRVTRWQLQINSPPCSRCASYPCHFLVQNYSKPKHASWNFCCIFLSTFHFRKHLEKWGWFSVMEMAPVWLLPPSLPCLPSIASFLGVMDLLTILSNLS